MAYHIRDSMDHDGVELVARPFLRRRVVAVGTGGALAVALGVVGLVGAEIGVLVLAGIAGVAPLLWSVAGERTALAFSSRYLQVGARRVAIEDIEAAVEAQGAVRITAVGTTFDIGQGWPQETRAWLVRQLAEVRVQRARQLETAGPEQPPPPALAALRGTRAVEGP